MRVVAAGGLDRDRVGRGPGIAQAWFYVVAVALLIVALPSIARVPEHHGAW